MKAKHAGKPKIGCEGTTTAIRNIGIDTVTKTPFESRRRGPDGWHG
jgi:hypothetical protein